MKLSSLATTALLLSVSSLSFAGSISSMDKTEVLSTLNDKTMTTISAATLNGEVIPNSFTGYFGKDGKMHGGFANKPDNAPQSDKGTWQVKSNGEICVHWEQWFNGKEQCVYLYKLSNAVLIVNTDNGFESLVLNKDLKAGDHAATVAN